MDVKGLMENHGIVFSGLLEETIDWAKKKALALNKTSLEDVHLFWALMDRGDCCPSLCQLLEAFEVNPENVLKKLEKLPLMEGNFGVNLNEDIDLHSMAEKIIIEYAVEEARLTYETSCDQELRSSVETVHLLIALVRGASEGFKELLIVEGFDPDDLSPLRKKVREILVGG